MDNNYVLCPLSVFTHFTYTLMDTRHRAPG